MRYLKLLTVLFVTAVVLFGCSKITGLFQDGKPGSQSEKGDTSGDEPSPNDVEFYNKYIEVLNTISPSVDDYQKTYYQIIPEPAKLTKSSIVNTAFINLYLTNTENNLKKFKRSYFEGGELSKLTTTDEKMKTEVETAFKEFLSVIDSFMETGLKVNDYYKDYNFIKDLSQAKVLDNELRNKYDEYSKSFDSFKSVLKKYKPKRLLKNPDEISNPDEKAVAILQNTLEFTIDDAEKVYTSFSSVDENSDLTEFKKSATDFKNKFEVEKSKVLSAPFSNKSNYLKHSFEDYFMKMVSDFITACVDFVKKSEEGKLKGNQFGYEYDNVKNRYNYMVQAFNTTIGMTNSFRVY